MYPHKKNSIFKKLGLESVRRMSSVIIVAPLFNSKVALNQHMFGTHIPTRIRETRLFCSLCGEDFWTELDVIKHLEEPMNGRKSL